MRAIQFIRLFRQLAAEKTFDAGAQDVENASGWTELMTNVFKTVAEKGGMMSCSHATGREYLFDFTWFPSPSGEADLPAVVIEHENNYPWAEFWADFWKTLCAFARLRVMFGYTTDPNLHGEWIRRVNTISNAAGWQFPVGTEDVIVLGHRGMTRMRDFVFFHRPDGATQWQPVLEARRGSNWPNSENDWPE